MITKSIQKKSPDKSSMRRLIQYLTGTQGKTSRVNEVMITNCNEINDPQLAALEMEAVQKLNQRSKADKTYHLLVSFRTGEDPNTDTLREIENELCRALGYSEHQRIAVVHRDTDNTHMHIAINKVHPEKLNTHTPFFDKLRLQNARIQIEQKHNLLLESGEQPIESPKPKDIERQSGIESLESWIKRQCLEEIKTTESWRELHRVLAESGLEIKARGNGLVIQTTDGVSVKASNVDRSLSKAKLENRFGVFEPKDGDLILPKRQYSKAPLQVESPKELTLYEEYQRLRANYDNQRAMSLQALSEERKKRIAISKTLLDAESKSIRAAGWSLANRLRFEAVKQQHKARVAVINQEIHGRRKAVYSDMGRVSWLSWLQKQAEAGREDAVSILKKRAHGLNKKFNSSEITGEAKPDAPVFENETVDAVTKKGTVLYQVGEEIVRREASAFRVSDESSIETTVMALKMAQRSFGNTLQINGDPKFKEKVIEAAVAGNLKITFTDKWMEEKRMKQLAERNAKQRRNVERRNEHGR